MAWTSYFMLSLLVAACIPVLNVIACWHYLRRGAPHETTHASVSIDRPGSRLAPDVAVPIQGDEALSMAARMKELAVDFDGRQYRFAGYRYDRLVDAIDYAELIRSRSALRGRT